MTLWDHACCIGYGIQARWDGIVNHWLKGHKGFYWRHEPSWWEGCSGHICCHECPDTEVENGKHVSVILWCRHNNLLNWFTQRICGLVGHPIFQHPKRGDEYVRDEVYCYRCGWGGGKLRAEWLEKDRWTGEDPGGPDAA